MKQVQFPPKVRIPLLVFAIVFVLIPLFFLIPSFSGIYTDPYTQASDGRMFRLQGEAFKFVQDTPEFQKTHRSHYCPSPTAPKAEPLDQILQQGHLYADVRLEGYRILANAQGEERSKNYDGSLHVIYHDLCILYEATVTAVHSNCSDVPVKEGDSLKLFIPYADSDSLKSRFKIDRIYRFDMMDSALQGESLYVVDALSAPCLLLSDFTITWERYTIPHATQGEKPLDPWSR